MTELCQSEFAESETKMWPVGACQESQGMIYTVTPETTWAMWLSSMYNFGLYF